MRTKSNMGFPVPPCGVCLECRNVKPWACANVLEQYPLPDDYADKRREEDWESHQQCRDRIHELRDYIIKCLNTAPSERSDLDREGRELVK